MCGRWSWWQAWMLVRQAALTQPPDQPALHILKIGPGCCLVQPGLDILDGHPGLEQARAEAGLFQQEGARVSGSCCGERCSRRLLRSDLRWSAHGDPI